MSNPSAQTISPAGIGPTSDATKPVVFIVHGHDDALKYELKTFLQDLGLKPIVLHEQTNEGRTIIEKFERHAEQAAFAVVLLTPDDMGGAKAAGVDGQKPRARENVIFEMGFFFGKIGRGKVAALLKGGVGKPGDIDGVVYLSADDQGWKLALAREIRAAKVPVDLNAL